ncbi:hypothetical protein PG993_008021 [Apiospora rasikravindrae]|uniref:Uncharacterized protein n=1 Tax=Apiospora rasikravindrae TaxID=990691 RepID=A0ABR1SZ59_9PEZI
MANQMEPSRPIHQRSQSEMGTFQHNMAAFPFPSPSTVAYPAMPQKDGGTMPQNYWGWRTCRESGQGWARGHAAFSLLVTACAKVREIFETPAIDNMAYLPGDLDQPISDEKSKPTSKKAPKPDGSRNTSTQDRVRKAVGKLSPTDIERVCRGTFDLFINARLDEYSSTTLLKVQPTKELLSEEEKVGCIQVDKEGSEELESLSFDKSTFAFAGIVHDRVPLCYQDTPTDPTPGHAMTYDNNFVSILDSIRAPP